MIDPKHEIVVGQFKFMGDVVTVCAVFLRLC